MSQCCTKLPAVTARRGVPCRATLEVPLSVHDSLAHKKPGYNIRESGKNVSSRNERAPSRFREISAHVRDRGVASHPE